MHVYFSSSTLIILDHTLTSFFYNRPTNVDFFLLESYCRAHDLSKKSSLKVDFSSGHVLLYSEFDFDTDRLVIRCQSGVR